jgi:hypothetical protein
MKTFAIVASMASIAAFASIPRDDEKPKPADELRILEDMIGEWDEEMTNKRAGDTTKSVTKKTWALGGKFIRMDGAWNPGKNEFHSLLAFDPMTKNYRTWYFDSSGTMPRNPMTGEWDAKARKMSWKAVDEGGITTVGVTTVVDKDNHHWTVKVTDKDGGILAELEGVNKRRKP